MDEIFSSAVDKVSSDYFYGALRHGVEKLSPVGIETISDTKSDNTQQ